MLSEMSPNNSAHEMTLVSLTFGMNAEGYPIVLDCATVAVALVECWSDVIG